MRLSGIFSVLLGAMLLSGLVQAQPVIYTDRAAFTAAAPPLLTETFEGGSPLPPLGECEFIGPAGADYPNACFGPGDLLPGIIHAVPLSAPDVLFYRLGPGVVPGLVSNGIGVAGGFLGDASFMVSAFEGPGHTAFGLDYFCPGDGPALAIGFAIPNADTEVIYETQCIPGQVNFFGVVGAVDILFAGVLVEGPVVIDNVSFDSLEPIDSDTARFVVTKNFSDDNPANVAVQISCNSGLPLEQDFVISDNGDTFSSVTFTIKEFVDGATDCTITETATPGYDASYSAFGSSSTVPDPAEPGCHFTGVSLGDQNYCNISNALEPVSWTVAVEWALDDLGGIEPLPVDIDVTCENVLEGSTGAPTTFTDSITLDPASPSQEYSIYPYHGTPGSRCMAEVVSSVSGVEVDQGCAEWQAIDVDGADASCTITNTMFFEGIPTLDRWGAMALILLMLGIGTAGFRRFV